MNTTFRTCQDRRAGKVAFNRTHALRGADDDGFACKHCGTSSRRLDLSGVQNRNHCPYCLWSRHLDLTEAGDRLSACKSPMRPIGLTVKATRKKYGPGRGELMLIHLCTECNTLSINRIAADDIPGTVFAVFEGSFRLDLPTQTRWRPTASALPERDRETVRAQLFGHEPSLARCFFRSGNCIIAKSPMLSRGLLSSLLEFALVFFGEQCRLSAGVPEQDGFILFEEALADQVDQPGGGPPGIDRVEQQTFLSGEQRMASRSAPVRTP